MTSGQHKQASVPLQQGMAILILQSVGRERDMNGFKGIQPSHSTLRSKLVPLLLNEGLCSTPDELP